MKKYLFFFLLLFSYIVSDYVLTYFFNLSETKIQISHPIFHHHFQPNYIDEKYNGRWGKNVTISNSLGFRDSSTREVDLNNKNRIVIIGDSFTEGVLLNYEDTFVGMIDKHFNKLGVEVLNAGVSSYSPIIYYYKIKYYLERGLKFSHLVVFIDISDIEDEAHWYDHDNLKKSVVQIKPHHKKHNIKLFISENFFISYKIIKFIDDNIKDKLIFYIQDISNGEKKFAYSFPKIETEKYTYDKYTISKKVFNDNKIGINKAIENMKLLKEILDKYDINMTIAVYPYFTQIYHNDLDSIHVKIWKNFSLENNISFLNYFPLFINKSEINEDFYEKVKKYYIPYDVHFNKNGNRLIADYFIKNFKF